MPTLLRATGLRAAHGDRVLFDDLSLSVGDGSVIGLVGANGAGKSTLLRILAGIEAPERGEIALSPRETTVGLLPQQVDHADGETVSDYLARRTGLSAAESALAASTDALARTGASATSAESYDDALNRWLSLGGADFDHRIGEVTHEVGLSVLAGQPMSSLSGGQAARARLAALLLSRFDVLLLDEPTNDLDLAGLASLEDFIDSTDAAIVLVSHDRELLRRLVTEVVEIDAAQHCIRHHNGTFEDYLQARELERRHARERYEEYEASVDDLRQRARRIRQWSDTGVRAEKRKPTDGDKLIRNRRIETTESLAGRARRAERQIERLEVVDEPRKEWDLQFSIAGTAPSGKVVATLNAARVDLGSFSLGPVTLQIDRGDRVAITGPNGSGKTTLLRLITGELAPAAGVAALGSAVRVGTIDQARAAFEGDRALLDTFAAEVPGEGVSEIRSLLAKFGLGARTVNRACSSLSAGERTRASLALLQVRGVNLLILDEPTNHLDLAAIEQLEEALAHYEGTLVLVSHDRSLLETIRVNRRFSVCAGEVIEEDLRPAAHRGTGSSPL